jgi:outer membrane protein
MKMVLKRLLSALLVSLTLGLPAVGDAAAEEVGQASPRVLTLDQAIAIADEQNRDIQKAREYSRWVYGKYLEERAQALPQLSLHGTQRRDEVRQKLDGPLAVTPMFSFVPGTYRTTTDTTGFDISLTQPLYTWGKIGAAIRAATVALSTADQQLRLYRQATRRDVTATFHDVLLARELHAIARQSLAQRERHLDEARKKLLLGTGTDYDVLAAEVALKNVQPAAIRTENDVRIARERLQFLLGQGAGSVDAAGTLVTHPASLPEYGAALSTALKRRPEVLNQESTLAINEELVTIAKAGNKPSVYLSGLYGKSFASADSYDTDTDAWWAGVFLTFPLFDGFRTKGQVVQAKSNLETSRIDMGRIKESIAIEIQVALDQVREAAEILVALRGTVQQAERLLQMAEKGYEFGVKTRLEVEDAQFNLTASQGNLARASRDYLVALTNLQWVQGVLGEEPEVGGQRSEDGKNTRDEGGPLPPS